MYTTAVAVALARAFSTTTGQFEFRVIVTGLSPGRTADGGSVAPAGVCLRVAPPTWMAGLSGLRSGVRLRVAPPMAGLSPGSVSGSRASRAHRLRASRAHRLAATALRGEAATALSMACGTARASARHVRKEGARAPPVDASADDASSCRSRSRGADQAAAV